MEDKNIIIILLLVIIAILVIGIGAMIINNNKQECKLTIKCNETMYDGEKVKIKLTDLNKTPIANAKIHINLTAGNTVKEYNITTNSKGTGTLSLNDLNTGNYEIYCTFNGNDHYKSASAKKKFSFDNVTTAKTSYVNPIDANRPVNDVNYKGYTPYHESEVTSEGWNPHEHEVSRQDMGNGEQKIRYDDGYFRIVDSNGYVITYGYS